MRGIKGLVQAIALTLGLVLAVAAGSSAATWHVKPDGSGDAATIQAAVWAAASGDTIFLANGTFTGDGNRDIAVDDMSVTIVSEGGTPALCIIDCGGSASENHQAFDCRVDAPDQVVIAGITIRGGYATGAAGVYAAKVLAGGGVVILANCAVTENYSQWDGAVVVVGDCQLSMVACQFTDNTGGGGAGLCVCAGATAVATGCLFADNATTYNGGAVWIGCYGDEAYATFINCNFLGNSAAQYYGGAIYCEYSSPTLLGCRFERNSAASQGGALYLLGGLSVTNCVFLGNTAEYGGSSLYASTADPIAIISCSFVADSMGFHVIEFGGDADPVLDQTVVAFATGASAIKCWNAEAVPALSCCNIFGNQYGDWTDCIAGQAGINGNISQDPRFCDIPTGDVSVEDCSPCLAANNACGQDIGAGVQSCLCGEATVPTTWGSIKSLYK